MTSPVIVRSPNLADGEPPCVIRLYEKARPLPFKNGGLARAAHSVRSAGRGGDDILLHINPAELAFLKSQWGEPSYNPHTNLPEYGLFSKIKQAMSGGVRMADGGLNDLLRTRTADPIDYYTYGEGPEHGFYKDNQIPTAPDPIHLATPKPPDAPKTTGGSAVDLATLAAIAKYGGKGAEMLGYPDPIKAGLNKGLDYLGLGAGAGLGSVGSGAAANAALADAGFGAGWATPGIAESVAGASGAGAGGAGAGAAGTGAGGAGAGAGLGALGAAGIGFAGVALASMQHKRGDEKRNITAWFNQFPETKLITQGGRSGQQASRYQLPDGRIVSGTDFEKLAGAWYGATAAPDGNQASWQKQYDELNSTLGHASGGAVRFADGGVNDLLRTRNADPIDYYTYGQGPEHGFYNNNEIPTTPDPIHLAPPVTPSAAPATGSAGSSAVNLATLGALAKYGSTASEALGYGNPIKAGLNYLKGGIGAGASTAGIGSGAAANAALADAGFGGSSAGFIGSAGLGSGAGAAGTAAAAAPASAAIGTGASATGAGAGGATTLGAVALPLAITAGFGPLMQGLMGDTKKHKISEQQAKAQEAWMGASGIRQVPTAGITYNNFGIPVVNGTATTDPAALASYQRADGTPMTQKEAEASLSEYLQTHHAAGGAIAPLSSSRYVRGPGTGRSDSIDAKLSNGEYVLTAEDVALLGDGSSEAGAEALDKFRESLRKHKGGALARGEISPNAKSPLEYLKGSS